MSFKGETGSRDWFSGRVRRRGDRQWVCFVLQVEIAIHRRVSSGRVSTLKGERGVVSCLLALHFWFLSLSMQIYSSLSSLSMILYVFKCGVFLVQAGQHV